jgi:hypothetical protein
VNWIPFAFFTGLSLGVLAVVLSGVLRRMTDRQIGETVARAIERRIAKGGAL